MTTPERGSRRGLGGASPSVLGAVRELTHAAGGRAGVLFDRGGGILATSLDGGDLDSATLSALAAAHFSAAERLASLLGANDFRGFVQQGHSSELRLSPVGEEWVMALVVERGARRRESAREWTRLESAVRGMTEGEREGEAMGRQWTREAESEIDRLFQGGWS